ncbi:MAG: hypothetical protein Fur005_35500 [Roseiflexaceae bacterium]
MLRRMLLELLLLLAVLGMSFASLSLAARFVQPFSVDLTVKSPDTRIELAGFHIPERNGEFRYRWSWPYAFFQIQNAATLAPGYIASVRLRVPAPDPDRRLTFLLNEQPVAAVVPEPTFRVYHLALPPGADRNFRLALSASELRLPSDARPLGVVLTGARIMPIRETPPTLLAVVLIGMAALWLVLRRTTVLWPTVLICVSLAGVVVAIWALAGPAPLPAAWMAGLALAAALAAALIGRDWLARWGLALLSPLVAFAGSLRPSWLTDDAFISFRYAQNFAQGHGLVYNLGERVEGYTNFLWTNLAALVLWLGADIVWWSYSSGIALALLILLMTFVFTRDHLGQHAHAERWALVAALIVATSQSLLIHTARGAGLETGLFTLLVLIGTWLVTRQQWVLAGVVLGCATLTRPEGALVLGVSGLFGLWQAWRKLPDRTFTPAMLPKLIRAVLPLACAYLLVVLPFFLWRFSYYGDLLPNTFYAKTGGGVRAALRGLEYTLGFVLALGGPALLLGLMHPRSAARTTQIYLLGICGLYTLYIISVGGDHFPGERFFVPLLPWLALLMASGLAACYQWLIHTPLRPAAAALLVVALAGYSAHASLRAQDQDVIVAGSDESLAIWREIGWWLADQGGPQATSAAMSAGAIAFYSERTTIDMLGLADRHIARMIAPEMGSGPAGHEKRDPAYVLSRRPTYIPQMWEDYFGGAEALRPTYELITITTRTGRPIGMWRLRS